MVSRSSWERKNRGAHQHHHHRSFFTLPSHAPLFLEEASIYDVRKIFGFLDPLPSLSLSQISWFCSFLLLFGTPFPLTYCRRHIWKTPYFSVPTHEIGRIDASEWQAHSLIGKRIAAVSSSNPITSSLRQCRASKSKHSRESRHWEAQYSAKIDHQNEPLTKRGQLQLRNSAVSIPNIANCEPWFIWKKSIPCSNKRIDSQPRISCFAWKLRKIIESIFLEVKINPALFENFTFLSLSRFHETDHCISDERSRRRSSLSLSSPPLSYLRRSPKFSISRMGLGQRSWSSPSKGVP